MNIGIWVVAHLVEVYGQLRINELKEYVFIYIKVVKYAITTQRLFYCPSNNSRESNFNLI